MSELIKASQVSPLNKDAHAFAGCVWLISCDWFHSVLMCHLFYHSLYTRLMGLPPPGDSWNDVFAREHLELTVVGEMKMGNIVPRVEIEPTSLAFWASVLLLHHVGSLISPLYPRLPVYTAPCLRRQCKPLHSSPWNCNSFNSYNYIHAGNGLTHRQGRFNNHTTHSLYRIMDMATIVMDVMKIVNTMSRVGLKLTSLTFRASVLPLHNVGSLMSPLYPRLPVYAAPCFRGQCRPLHY